MQFSHSLTDKYSRTACIRNSKDECVSQALQNQATYSSLCCI